jgi:hypothetical protein
VSDVSDGPDGIFACSVQRRSQRSFSTKHPEFALCAVVDTRSLAGARNHCDEVSVGREGNKPERQKISSQSSSSSSLRVRRLFKCRPTSPIPLPKCRIPNCMVHFFCAVGTKGSSQVRSGKRGNFGKTSSRWISSVCSETHSGIWRRAVGGKPIVGADQNTEVHCMPFFMQSECPGLCTYSCTYIIPAHVYFSMHYGIFWYLWREGCKRLLLTKVCKSDLWCGRPKSDSHL